MPNNEANERVGPGHTRLWIVLTLALLALKIVLASRLDLFGDEAFYRWESRHLALGYSDVPGLTPWLIRFGADLAGGGRLGMRWPFLLLGAAVPWLTYRLARLTLDRRQAGMAAALGLGIPLAALAGVLALPDVPLTVAMLGSTYFLARLTRRERWRDAVALGLCLALGWLSHYRFAMLYVAGFAYLGLSVRGRPLFDRWGFWLAQFIGLAGFAPALVYNLHNHYSALRFQFVERHPWSFHADGLAEAPIQAVVTTPLMFAAIVVALVSTFRGLRGRALAGRDVTREQLALMALSLLGAYLVLDCFEDTSRWRLHWPLPVYLIALPLLPPLLEHWRARGGWRAVLAWATPATAALGVVMALAWVANAARPLDALDSNAGRYVPDNLVGWSRVADWAAPQRDTVGNGAIRIADNFMLAAEWADGLADRDEPFVLDHPLNTKHGRAAQLALWGLDEAALRKTAWSQGLLLVEETARRPIEVLPAYRSLCARFGGIEFRDELVLRGGRSRFLAFAVEPGLDADKADRCRLPPLADLWSPLEGARIDADSLEVRGWAFEEFVGVEKVEVALDGKIRSSANYGVPAPQVKNQWPTSQDPNHPNVGFVATVALRGLAPGRHRFSLRVTDADGRIRELAGRWIELAGKH